MRLLYPQTTTTTKSAVAEKLVPQSSALDKRGMPIGEHEITYLKVAQMREILPVDQWLQSHMHNEVTQDTARRLLLQTCYTVTRTLRPKYPIRVERNHGVISVFANVDILTGHLVVPLFVRKLTSIVMEGEGSHQHGKSVPVEVEWTEASPSLQLQDVGCEKALEHTITRLVKEEVRLPKEAWEARDWQGVEDLHPF